MKAPPAGIGISSLGFLVFLLSFWGEMEEENCSWVTRARFSPTVYLRSSSFGSSDYKSDRCLDLEGKSLIAESEPRDPDSGSSIETLQSMSVLPVSESKKNSPVLDSPFVNSAVKTDRKSSNVSSDSCPFKSSFLHGSKSFSHPLNDSDSQTDDFSFHSDEITSPNPMKDSNYFSSDSCSFKSSLQHSSSQSSSCALNDSDTQTAEFSFRSDEITSSNPLKDSNYVSSDVCYLKSFSQLGHSQSVSSLATKSISQTVDFSFNPDRSISMRLPPKDSNLVSSDSFSCKWFPQHGYSKSLLPMPAEPISQTLDFSCNPDVSMSKTLPLKNLNLVFLDLFANKSSLLHRRSQSLNPIKKASNSQPVEFSFHSDVRTNSNTKNLDYCTPCFASSMKKEDPRLHYTCLLPDQKERKPKPKLRSVSPLPRSILSDVFKEAKGISKRFSTPPPHRDEPGENVTVNYCSYNERKPLQQISSGKVFNKSRAKKDTHRVTALETTQKWIVDLSELYFGARFASGAHSRLYHGRYKDQPVAVKIIRLPDDDENGVMAARMEKQFTREAAFLSHLCHLNVIKLAGACKNSPILFIITEYLSGGSLRAFLHKLDHSPLPLDKLISIALDVSRGMEYIHSQGIIHRDLKPENILFDHNHCVKIADFGVACEEAYCDVLEDDAGTYRWMAPEMIKHKPYGRKVDVYSFGLLLWEMLTGAIPYEDMTPVQAAFAVVNKNLRPVIPVDSPVVLRVLIEQCWSTIPEKRPEFWQIVKVLEQFESDLARGGGALRQLQNLTFQDHKKRLLNWVEKLRPPKVEVS